MDDQQETIKPCHYPVVGYKNETKKQQIWILLSLNFISSTSFVLIIPNTNLVKCLGGVWNNAALNKSGFKIL